MKLVISAIVFWLLVLFGCSSTQIGRYYEFKEPNTIINSGIGYLKIHTLENEEKGDYADDPVYKVFKGYSIYDREGNLIQNVDKAYHKPEVVKLKEGQYIILAELYPFIIHSFIINIEKGKVLELDKSMIENPYAVK